MINKKQVKMNKKLRTSFISDAEAATQDYAVAYQYSFKGYHIMHENPKRAIISKDGITIDVCHPEDVTRIITQHLCIK